MPQTQNSVKSTLSEILESAGFPILPVAPAFSALEYPSDKNPDKPKFNGKNPSYLNGGDKPVLVKHQQFIDRKPTMEEKERWFAKTQNRGVLLVGLLVFIDLDRKNFKSQNDCDKALSTITDTIPDCTVEQSVNGGYHIPVFCDSLPDFKNFKIEGTGHIGEILKAGNPGFVVLSPSAGYKLVKSGNIPKISSVADLGILQFKASTEQPIVQASQKADSKLNTSEAIPNLIDLMSKKSKVASTDDDRSSSIVEFAKESNGWVNFCTTRGLGFVGSAESLIEQFASDLGVESERIARILADVDLSKCQPAIYWSTSGSDEAVLQHYRKSTGRLRKQNQYEDAGMNHDEIPVVMTKSGEWRLPDHAAFASYIVAKFGDSIGKWNGDIYVRSSKTGLMTKHYTGLYGTGENLRLMITNQTRLTTIGDMSGEFSNPWLVGCESCLVARVKEFKPCDDRNLLPVKNGVLNVSKGFLHTYDELALEGKHFVWQSEASFNPSAQCPNFSNWVEESVEDDEKALLKAVMFGTLTGRYDQKFCVELIGKRDTGKSVLHRVMTAMFGGNQSGVIFSVDVKKLLNPDARHATSNIVGKKLVLIPDTKGYVGSSDTFKQISSGGDLLEAERKNKDSTNFVFEGILWIAGNDSIRFADDDDATRSRRLQIHFPKTVPIERQESLLDFRSTGMVGKFAHEVDGILNWILSAKDTAIDTILEAKKRASRSADLAREDNYLILWLEDSVALVDGEFTQIGEPQNAMKGAIPTSLYGSYRSYCEKVGAKTKGMNAFKKELLETCKHYQENVKVFDKRKNNKSVIFGLVLNADSYGNENPIAKTGFSWDGQSMAESRDEPETVSNVALEASTKKQDDTYYRNVPIDQIQVGDDVTDKQTRQMLRVIEIKGNTISLGDINNGLPDSIRNRSDCVDARRLEKFTDF